MFNSCYYVYYLCHLLKYKIIKTNKQKKDYTLCELKYIYLEWLDFTNPGFLTESKGGIWYFVGWGRTPTHPSESNTVVRMCIE